MPHIYIPELAITQDEYDMIQDNQVPIDAYDTHDTVKVM